MKVLVLDTKPANANRYIAEAVLRAFSRHPRVSRALWAGYGDALERALADPPDLFVAFGGEEAGNAIVDRLAAIASRRAIWFTEDPYERSRNRVRAAGFDLVLTSDAGSVAGYGQAALHLPLAADPANNRLPVPDTLPAVDMFFAGTAWPNRLEFLDRLQQRLGERRLDLVLVTWPELDPFLGPLREKFTFSSPIPIQEFSRRANQALVTLLLPRRFSTTEARDTASDTPGPRLFEAALAGACQLVERGALPDLGRLYREGAHYLSFSDPEECAALTAQLVFQPSRARAISREAQAHTERHHLYDNRVAVIMERAASLPARPRSFPERPPRRLDVPAGMDPWQFQLALLQDGIEQVRFARADPQLARLARAYGVGLTRTPQWPPETRERRLFQPDELWTAGSGFWSSLKRRFVNA